MHWPPGYTHHWFMHTVAQWTFSVFLFAFCITLKSSGQSATLGLLQLTVLILGLRGPTERRAVKGCEPWMERGRGRTWTSGTPSIQVTLSTPVSAPRQTPSPALLSFWAFSLCPLLIFLSHAHLFKLSDYLNLTFKEHFHVSIQCALSIFCVTFLLLW